MTMELVRFETSLPPSMRCHSAGWPWRRAAGDLELFELIEAAADIMLTENRRYLGNVLPPVTVFELSTRACLCQQVQRMRRSATLMPSGSSESTSPTFRPEGARLARA